MGFLVKCSVCGGSVSSNAVHCPHCGETHFMPSFPSITINTCIKNLPPRENLHRTSLDKGTPYAIEYVVCYEISTEHPSLLNNIYRTEERMRRLIRNNSDVNTINLLPDSIPVSGILKVSLEKITYLYTGDEIGDMSFEVIESKEYPVEFTSNESMNIHVEIGSKTYSTQIRDHTVIGGFWVPLPFKKTLLIPTYHLQNVSVHK